MDRNHPNTVTNQSYRYEGVFDDNFSYFSSKPYAVTPHLNRLDETVQMRRQNICFNAKQPKLSLIIIKYPLLSGALTNALSLLHVVRV